MKFRVFLASVSLVSMTGAALADGHLTPPSEVPGVIAQVSTEDRLNLQKASLEEQAVLLTSAVDGGTPTPYDTLKTSIDGLDPENEFKAAWTEYIEAVRAGTEAGEDISDLTPPEGAPPLGGDTVFKEAAEEYEVRRVPYRVALADREFVTGAQAEGKTGKALADFLVGEEGAAETLDRAVLGSFEQVDNSLKTLQDNIGIIEQAFQAFGSVQGAADQIGKNQAAIAANSNRIENLEDEVETLKGGVAMAVAIANAPIITNGENKFSLSGGLGYYEDAFALSAKGAFMPTNNVAITGSVATDFEGFTAGAGVGIGF